MTSPRADPQLAERLRRIALHQETATLLRLRADKAHTAGEAHLLQRRAAQHHQIAAELRAYTVARPQRRSRP